MKYTGILGKKTLSAPGVHSLFVRGNCLERESFKKRVRTILRKCHVFVESGSGFPVYVTEFG